MKKKIRIIKLEDLAKKLHVSKVTISKALRNHPDISPETTAKVKALAEKLGYIPNFMAKNLSARKSNIIGLVIPKIAHFFFGSVIESVYDTALRNNYETVITVSQEIAEREKKHILSFLSMRVDGLIISITQEQRIFQSSKEQETRMYLLFLLTAFLSWKMFRVLQLMIKEVLIMQLNMQLKKDIEKLLISGVIVI